MEGFGFKFKIGDNVMTSFLASIIPNMQTEEASAFTRRRTIRSLRVVERLYHENEGGAARTYVCRGFDDEGGFTKDYSKFFESELAPYTPVQNG